MPGKAEISNVQWHSAGVAAATWKLIEGGEGEEGRGETKWIFVQVFLLRGAPPHFFSCNSESIPGISRHQSISQGPPHFIPPTQPYGGGLVVENTPTTLKRFMLYRRCCSREE